MRNRKSVRARASSGKVLCSRDIVAAGNCDLNVAHKLIKEKEMATPVPARPNANDWTKPAAIAIPKEGYFELEKGRYGPIYPKTPANYGFTVFENLEGFPMDWKTNPPAFVKFVREHQCPSFLEYGEYPFVTADEIKKALKVKASLSSMLDQMQ